MREIVAWRWIFGLAVFPAALLAWSGADALPDEGLFSRALILYPICVLAVWVLTFVAMWACVLALGTWDFTRRLLGLRGEARE